MSLTVETGSGIAGAEAYASEAQATAYWGARAHSDLAATWDGASQSQHEGALREASAFLDAVYGKQYRGARAGYVQGLEWPRSAALDDQGFALPDLPPQLVAATCELAARALSGQLIADAEVDAAVLRTRSKIGQIEEETEFAPGATRAPRYGFVDRMLAPLLGGASSSGWAWA